MSREVDQRVVEMQFNNANFEKNTKKSMDSIDRMMEKLQFKGAEKGFEKLDRAAQDVDFDHMSRSLDLLEEKFSTLNIIGTTALVNITNKVMDAGEKMVKSLSLDQISSGWGKYVEKTGNVQTIMNGTGKSIDQVNGYLSKLMWYSDETSFSFNEMTSAISTAVSTGADLDEVLPMIMGIANATADAGKGGEAFAHSIRNLMQSYSTGYLQLQDWNSLALAGTNSKTMVDALIEAGKALGTLNAEGKTAKGTLVNASTFRDTLSEKWATKAVMERAFGKYADMTLAVYDAVQSGDYDTASEAIEALSGQYDAVSERAFKAAQQAKSFSEAIDATKDAVSTSWMKVFETIFGNKEEATDTWTELSNRLYDIFVPSIEALNERLKEGLDSGWQQLWDEMGDNADAYEYALQKIALKTGAVTQEQIQDAGSFGKALQEGSVDADLLLRGISESRRELEGLLQLSDEELDARGLDRDAIQNYADGFADLSKRVQTGTLKLGDFSKKIGEVSGREHLTKSLWNLWDAIGKVTGSIKGAFDEIFPPASGERIYTIAERLDDFTGKLIISDAAAKKIKMTFKGVFRVLKVGVDVLKKVGSAAAGGLGLLTDAAKPAGSALLDITAGLGEFTARIIEVLSGSGTLEEKLNTIREACRKLLDPLNGLGTALKNTKLGQKLDELLQKGEQTSGVLGVLYRTGKNAFTRLSALAEGVASGSLTLLGGLGLAIGSALQTGDRRRTGDRHFGKTASDHGRTGQDDRRGPGKAGCQHRGICCGIFVQHGPDHREEQRRICPGEWVLYRIERGL